MSYKPPIAEPMAIVGSSCRFAGGVNTPSKLWHLLANPTDLTRDIPKERFNIEAFYHPDGEYHGTTNSPKAYFLDHDHRVFDASFFNITPREAEAIDPQQRMLLEVVYEALEDAGYTLRQYAGEKVAVFAGLMTGDYDTLSQRDELDTSQYYATGNARSILSNRISYFFDFNGPSMTIDTACSSSLVALHQAVLSLRSGECDIACVAGANLIVTPEQFIVESNLHMLSPTGHCRMWDADADGYARGEGVAALFIKPLSKAIEDGDDIQAIIRETGVNSDGRSRGITMPNWEAQSQLIQDTYRRAGLDSKSPVDRCQYFEAHGTGTGAGDPNEARAIEAAFFGHANRDATSTSLSASADKLLVGSVKTVIGHTEGAAGLAGLMKVVQSMRNDSVPPNLHLQKLNPAVEKYYGNLLVPTAATAWPHVPAGQPKRGSVNSFGFGGTNAHAIIEQYIPNVHNTIAKAFRPALASAQPVSPGGSMENAPVCLPMVLSAPSQKALVAVAKTYRDYLLQGAVPSPHDVAWHTFARRTAFPFRVSVSGLSASGLVGKLGSLIAKGESSSTATIGTRARPDNELPKILGVFTGQGAQWATMSRGLLLSSQVYASTIRSLDDILEKCPDPPSWSLEGEIMADEGLSRVGKAEVSQPLCTAVQLALVNLLRHLGVSFYAVVGHSSGEIAAAYAAGKISMRDAMLIAHYRGMGVSLACGATGAKGGMLAAALTKEEAEAFCARPEYCDRLWVAASNAPATVTLSGDLDAVDQAVAHLGTQQKFVRKLKVDTAYHSPHMNGPSVKYLDVLNACDISPSAEGNGTAWVSSVYGLGEPSNDELKACYWRDNMAKPVLFYQAVGTAIETLGPFDCAIEVGPHPALKGPVIQTLQEKGYSGILYSGVLDRQLDDREAFADFLGWMWTQFGSSSPQVRQFVLGSVHPRLVHNRLVGAPSYPWDHSQAFYRESRISRQYHFKTDKPHELLGVRTRDDNKHQLRWRNILKLEKLPWVKHHSFQGQALLPASAYLVMALDAARAALAGRQASVVELRGLKFPSGIILEPNTPGVEVLFSLTIEAETHDMVTASTDMKKSFSGKLAITLAEPTAQALPSRPKNRAETAYADPESFYDMMAGTGLVYTAPFKGLRTLERRYNFSSGTLNKFHPEDATGLSISPATLDSCLQTAFVTISSPGDNAIWTSFLPLDIDSVRFNLAICDIKNRDDDSLAVDAYMTKATPITRQAAASFTADIEIFNPRGDMEIQVQGLTVGSFSSTKPEEDYELYLTTKLDVDPDHEIVAADGLGTRARNPMLAESCERVASFYTRAAAPDRPPHSSAYPLPANSWPTETEATLNEFVLASPYFPALDFIRQLGEDLPDLLVGVVPAVVEETHQLVEFQKHISRVVRQIAHKYPRMNVLGLTDPKLGITEHVLAGLDNTFLSYRIGSEPEANLENRVLLTDALRKKIMVDKVNLDAAEPEKGQYDLVILATSLIDPQKTAPMLAAVNGMMREGGFLLVVHVPLNSLKGRIHRYIGYGAGHSPLSLPDWPDFLAQSGFGQSMKNSNQYYRPGFQLIVRQAASQDKSRLLHPLASSDGPQLVDRLLVVGGKQPSTSRIVSKVRSALAARCGAVEVVETLDSLDIASVPSLSAAIFLNDMDEPVLACMTEPRMEALRALFKPQMIILWVTRNSRVDNPDHAASFGFTRTLAAETPDLALQVLDLDTMDTLPAVGAIAETFARLTMHRLIGNDDETPSKPLWINEPEVHLEDGRRLVPRVVPWKEGNNRANAPRRVVSDMVNTLETTVRVVANVDNNSSLDVKALYPRDGAWVINMLPTTSKMCETLKKAVNLALSKTATWDSEVEPAMVTVPDVLRVNTSILSFQTMDWKAERGVQHIVKPLAGTRLLDPAKTYVLIGLTRDFGQSLRNPPKVAPQWQTEMRSKGINVRFEALDVTNLEKVVAFKSKLAETLPPVGGVVNGAMVLEDRVFSQMSLETLYRVMNPKTVGSKNLDTVFDNADMDFFIMTSSFAAIGGHAGQSNYAAANMYMNGLAASRRRRGLPGSVLNIGVIYGLGFLHREKNDLYKGLEHEGYPPISERDIHHMFVEAIAAGKPTANQIHDITTGLRRFPWPHKTLHWHSDPRFSHYAKPADDADADLLHPDGAQKQSLRELVDGAATRDALVDVLAQAFIARLQSQLRLADGSVTRDHTIVELGVDSLAAVEVRAWIWKALGQDVAVMKILGGATIGRLCQEMAATIMEARARAEEEGEGEGEGEGGAGSAHGGDHVDCLG
ncbi:ketoacyl-synt-domain-containing protein [Trichocladium antarcticum]|uniref:Ketoacyl-synt-domain-containing protein n=1 Tax=Trichocladium antarcticum TaxID=1450529 RepID=A0AAN6UE32_9PEZI|nr:ketoacyl-synt-domain-containing protein [Trichocladium antarcticum]